VVLEPAGPAGLGAAGEGRGLERPAHQRHGVDVPERTLEGLVLAGGDPVAGDAEILHTHTRGHGGVLSEGVSMVRSAAAGVTGIAGHGVSSRAYRCRYVPGMLDTWTFERSAKRWACRRQRLRARRTFPSRTSPPTRTGAGPPARR